MAPRTNHTTRIPSGVASPVTTEQAAKGSVFVNLRNPGNLEFGNFVQLAALSVIQFETDQKQDNNWDKRLQQLQVTFSSS